MRTPPALDELPPWKALAATILTGGLVVGVFLAALIASAGIITAAKDFEGSAKLRALAQRSTVYDSKGNVLAVLGTLNREEVQLRDVPKILRQAVIAVEDKTFW